jgi:hypothetical protein
VLTNRLRSDFGSSCAFLMFLIDEFFCELHCAITASINPNPFAPTKFYRPSKAAFYCLDDLILHTTVSHGPPLQISQVDLAVIAFRGR